jgi:hypothetical protein
MGEREGALMKGAMKNSIAGFLASSPFPLFPPFPFFLDFSRRSVPNSAANP